MKGAQAMDPTVDARALPGCRQANREPEQRDEQAMDPTVDACPQPTL